ncbi:ATP-binding protein [Microbacterium sp. NPDC089189]|uniref:ATP-binding protein n=1 Tax=Microbacterium sp. NPDC089189 TaxID=3154972 RepID=UPI003422E924
MRTTRFPASAATRLFLAITATALAVAVILSVLLVLEAERTERVDAERLTAAIAGTLADDPFVSEGLRDAEPSTVLQPFAASVMASTRLDFVTIMSPDGIRYTHRDPAQIGARYIGTIPDEPVSLTEQREGTLGPSVRTVAPVLADGEVIGWVSAGMTLGSIGGGILERLPFTGAMALLVIAAGLVGAALARRGARAVTGDRAAADIRETLASAESMRTLGEALRAQTHEHGNRVHTAVALIELGRSAEAIGVLTDSTRSSQDLVDQVTARGVGDPTVGALLLGKTSQAKERGIELRTRIDADAPRSALSPVDAVAVVGNLIDNALDAAAAGPDPRTVAVTLRRAGDDLEIVVSDSGPGIPAELRHRVFERGFTTKAAGPEGRGVGLALVHDIVTAAGGSIRLDPPSTFRVRLRARA